MQSGYAQFGEEVAQELGFIVDVYKQAQLESQICDVLFHARFGDNPKPSHHQEELTPTYCSQPLTSQHVGGDFTPLVLSISWYS